MKEYDLAKRFLVFTNKILTEEAAGNDIMSRIERDIRKCILLDKELFL